MTYKNLSAVRNPSEPQSAGELQTAGYSQAGAVFPGWYTRYITSYYYN